MEELKLQTTLPAVGFNFEELKAWAQGITERYAGLVVREEDVAGIKHEMAELNKTKASLEQARQDRAVAIEEKCKALAATYGFDLPVSSFLRLQDLQTPLAEVHAQIETAYAAKAAANQRAEAAAQAPQPGQPIMQPVPFAPQAPRPPSFRPRQAKSLTLDLTFAPAREMEIMAVVRHLESLCITLARVPGRAAA